MKIQKKNGGGEVGWVGGGGGMGVRVDVHGM